MLTVRALIQTIPSLFGRLPVSSHRISCRAFSAFPTQLSVKHVITCDLLQSHDSNFRFDHKATTIFQFDDSPSTEQYTVPAITDDAVDTAWLNATDCTNNELVERLIYVSNFCAADCMAIERTDFDAFVDTLTARLPEFGENEFIAALQVFIRMPNKSADTFNVRNYVELLMAFDDITGFWTQKWTNEKMLIACNVWMHMHLRRKLRCCHVASKKLLKRAKHLPAKQFVQAMTFRKALGKGVDEKTPFIKDLERILDDVSVAELGILCGVLEKSKTSRLTKPELLHRILAKVLAEPSLDAIGDKPLYHLICVIQDSIRLEHREAALLVIDKLCAQIPHRPAQVAQQICVIGERIHVYHEGCIRALIHKALNNVADFNLRELEQTCFTLSKFGIEPEFREAHQLCQLILAEIPKRTEELVIAPRRLIPLLYGLVTMGHHNEQLIDNALRPDFIDAVYPHYTMFPAEIYGLDAFAKVNLRDTYKGNCLVGKNAKAIIKHVMSFVPEKNGPYKLSKADCLLIEVGDIVADLHEHFYIGHALPHAGNADIYMIFDKKEKKFIDYSEQFPKPYSGLIMCKDDLTQHNENLEVLVLVSSYWKNYRGASTTPSTLHQHKLKQLELLGYKYVDVCCNVWVNLDASERRNYIADKIDKTLKTNENAC